MEATNGPILVAVNGTPPPEGQLPKAVDLARQLGCGLILVHPADLVDGPTLLVPADLRYLDRVAARARKRGVASDVFVAPGDPADVVLTAARAAHARCIVLVGHPPRGTGKYTPRNIAEQVRRRASVPVLVEGSTEVDPIVPGVRDSIADGNQPAVDGAGSLSQSNDGQDRAA